MFGLCILVSRSRSVTVDVFTISWSGLKFYTFPPFILLPRVFRKIANDRAQGVVVVLWWPSQAWFPLFSCLLTRELIIFTPSTYSHLLSRIFTRLGSRFSWQQGAYQASSHQSESSAESNRSDASIYHGLYN